MVSTKRRDNMTEQNAREKILQAAIKVFAEKSYEGSRVDDISREAKVTKSLIYYHFKSKADILEVLTTRFISEYTNIISAGLDETHQEKAQELPERMKSVYYEFGQKYADLVRVIFIDSLKKSTEKPILFKILDALIEKEAENKSETGYDIQERRVAEFFTSFIPSFAYVCYAESWIKYYNMDKKQFDNLFLKVYEETHGSYHNNHK
jgi:AcrR family transcriptional regulator